MIEINSLNFPENTSPAPGQILHLDTFKLPRPLCTQIICPKNTYCLFGTILKILPVAFYPLLQTYILGDKY